MLFQMGFMSRTFQTLQRWGEGGWGWRKGAQLANARPTYRSLSKLHGAEAKERDGVEGDIKAVRIVGEGDEAVDTVCEGCDLGLRDKVKVVPHNLFDGVKCHAHNGLPLIAGCCCEDHEHGLPARLDIVDAGKHHLRTTPVQTQNNVITCIWVATTCIAFVPSCSPLQASCRRNHPARWCQIPSKPLTTIHDSTLGDC